MNIIGHAASILFSVLSILFAFGIIVFIHEFGHFIACKMIGIRVIKFAFAFGNEIFGFDWKGTRYSIGWIPLGGFVKPAGEDYFEQKEDAVEPPKSDEYFGKTWYQRLGVVVAGPFMNYLLAFLIFTMVFWGWGGNPKFLNTTVIGAVKPDMAAAQAGLTAGDRIIRINEQEVGGWDEMATIIHGSADVILSLTVERGSETFEVAITPQRDAESNAGLIGIYPDMQVENMGLFASIKSGAQMTWIITVKTISYIGGKIRHLEKPKDISGPIGIVKFISDAAHAGFREFISLVGLLSVAIGLFNLFPIPLLDGGHLVFYLFEGLLRRPLNRKIMIAANYAGMAVLLTILMYASYNDIARLRQEKSDTPAVESNEERAPGHQDTRTSGYQDTRTSGYQDTKSPVKGKRQK